MITKPSIFYSDIETGCYYNKMPSICQEYLDFGAGATIFYQQKYFKAFFINGIEKSMEFLPKYKFMTLEKGFK